MDNTRMGNADMIQYCDEALAWSDLGPIDIYFFQSVKNILLGKCSATEEPEDYPDDLMGIERPVRDVELEPEYGNFADIYYGEEGDDDIPNYSINLEVSDEELAERRKTMPIKKKDNITGYLKRYADMVSSADKGAIINK